ncbi:MAG: hypothetical protein MRERV_7c031 [Mycoplasmataceae bacterium RV_VA103A]|nr:MAG: hypothetical protein MRERV_7c031 [Mycoplasmataceae bacterium RV_VA103A]
MLEKYPSNPTTKKQMEFVKEVLKRGNENEKYGEPFDWATLWQDWERNNFC